ncbi:C2 domain-containing protein, partial [Hysterangium stoloniferum]
RNLPNKRHIGKQDPYCSVRLNGETRRTKAVKRGGQHPEWDEEVRFTILEEVVEEPPPPPPKDGEQEVVKEKEKEKGKRKIKGGTQMQLMCYADDPKDPDLIGETMVDLTEALTKGETDEWFTLMNKDKYCGEVFLELTFWSNV